MGYNVVVVGATGNVGREMLNILPSAPSRWIASPRLPPPGRPGPR